MTHSDVPGAFAVGFVETREAFAGHHARVCDHVSSTGKEWPEKQKPQRKTAVPFKAVQHFCSFQAKLCARTHTIFTYKPTVVVCVLRGLKGGRIFFFGSLSRCVFFITLSQTRKQCACCVLTVPQESQRRTRLPQQMGTFSKAAQPPAHTWSPATRKTAQTHIKAGQAATFNLAECTRRHTKGFRCWLPQMSDW